MNRRNTIVGAGLVTMALAGTWLNGAHAAPQVYLNGQPLNTGVAPVQVRGRTLVPMRDIFEALGASVQWNALTQGIVATKGTTMVNLQINNSNALVDGRNVHLDQPAVLVDGRTMVPLRFVSEAMGAQVNWNPVAELVSISTGAPLDTTPIGTIPLPANPVPTAAVAEVRTISIPDGVVVPVTLDAPMSSATAQVGSLFTTTVTSQRLGDSEFPAGTKLEGRIVEAVARTNADPGRLDFDFRNAILPDGTRVPLRGELIALDNTNVATTDGRITAKSTGNSGTDRLKVIGIGAGAGYLVGKVLLKQNGVLSAVLGAAGGYLYDRSRDRTRTADATLAQGTKLGIRLTSPVSYADSANYSEYRTQYLRVGGNLDYMLNPAQQPVGYLTDNRDNTNDNWQGTNTGNVNTGGQVVNTRTLSIPAGTVVPVTLDTALSSATARVNDRFTATVVSQREGDSEFPAGTRIEGIIREASARSNDNPGVLDLDFRNVILPDGSRYVIDGELISLDSANVNTTDGRLTAKATGGSSTTDRLKVIGVGAGAGYLVGKVLLKQNGVLSAVLGAAGGYLYDRSRDRTRTADAVVAQNTRLGVKLNRRVAYNDTAGYSDYRTAYLQPGSRVDYMLTPAQRPVYTDNQGNLTLGEPGQWSTDTRYETPGTTAGITTITIPDGAVVPVTLDNALSSVTTKKGQRFTATVVSQQLGDSEFPAGTKLVGTIVDVQQKAGDNPGVLDLSFQSAILPDGTRLPFTGELTALDDSSVTTADGRVMAKNTSRSTGDRLKVIGVGAGAGYLIGKVLLKQNGVLSAILGAAGGFLYDRSKDSSKAADANIPAGTRLGVRMDGGLRYTDRNGYATHRAKYVRM